MSGISARAIQKLVGWKEKNRIAAVEALMKFVGEAQSRLRFHTAATRCLVTSERATATRPELRMK